MASPIKKLFGTIIAAADPAVENAIKTVVTTLDKENRVIPASFDGRVVWKDYLTPIYNQGNSNGCYAFAAVSCLSDRYALQTILQVKPVFNPLQIVACMFDSHALNDYAQIKGHADELKQAQTKHLATLPEGNTIYNVGRFLFRRGAVEESCIPVKIFQDALDQGKPFPFCVDIEGSDDDLCLNNKIAERIWPISNFYIIPGKNVELINNLKLNIMKWGPLLAAFNVFPDFINKYSDGTTIYTPKSGQVSLGGHSIKIVGWGTEDKIPYWICANSWGVEWGDHGYFKIAQGNSDLDLENNHMDMCPQIPGISIIPLSQIIKLITDTDKKDRTLNDIDPLTFYTKRALDLVKQGKLQGSLKPVIDINRIPLRLDFYAYELGNTTFMTYGGKYIGTSLGFSKSLKSFKSLTRSSWFSTIIFFIIIGIISLGYMLWKCKKDIRLKG